MVNDQTLSHSVFIDRKNKIRKDTLRNDKTTIVSIYHFGEKRSQDIFIDNKKVSHYKETNDSSFQDILLLLEYSFRHFSFKGRPYYYLDASIMDCGMMPVCKINYHLLYDIKNDRLLTFFDYRTTPYLLFGDIDGNDDLDMLGVENEGGYGNPENDTNHFSIKINSISKSGKEYQLKDKDGKPYFIEGNTGDSRYVGDSAFNIDRFYWPKKLQ